MEKHSRAVRRYLREIRGWLPCSGRMKRGILERIENTIREYLTENPDVSYVGLTERFGMPQQIAATYVEEMGTDELLRDLRIRRRIVRTVAAAMLSVVILWAGLVAASYVDHRKNVNGYLVVGEATAIERNEINYGADKNETST